MSSASDCAKFDIYRLLLHPTLAIFIIRLEQSNMDELWLTILKLTVSIFDIIFYPVYWLWYRPSKKLEYCTKPKHVYVEQISENEGRLVLTLIIMHHILLQHMLAGVDQEKNNCLSFSF